MTRSSADLKSALVAENVTVAYGDFTALRDVSAEFPAAKIHAIVGENGAGKTTFARVCAGMVRPKSGSLRVFGRSVSFGNVRDSRDNGIELVHQSFALPPSFTVAEVLEYGSTRKSSLFYTKRALEKRWQPHLESLRVRAALSDVIRNLPIETQQAIEIARALSGETRVLILDEPTAVLSPSGIDGLFSRLRQLRDAGATILIVLHKVREVLAVADTISVLRRGSLVTKVFPRAEMDAESLASAVIGLREGELPHSVTAAPTANQHTSSVLHVIRASANAYADEPALREASLTIKAGEIVGIAGIEGNGQRQLVRVIAGLGKLSGGKVVIGGDDVSYKSLEARRARGLRIIPFERNSEGLSLTSSLWENWAARSLVRKPFFEKLQPTTLRALAQSAMDKWQVRYSTIDQLAASLSGGNAQRLILSREIDDEAQLIIAAQPTQGLDITAVSFVLNALRLAARRGCGVLVISSDLEELFSISHRIVVMFSGCTVGDFAAPFDIERIGSAMTGASA